MSRYRTVVLICAFHALRRSAEHYRAGNYGAATYSLGYAQGHVEAMSMAEMLDASTTSAAWWFITECAELIQAAYEKDMRGLSKRLDEVSAELKTKAKRRG